MLNTNLELPEFQGSQVGDSEDYLIISVTRHGPKNDLGGPLTEQGKIDIEQYYIQAYKNRPDLLAGSRKLISSPIERVQQTATIFENVLEQHYQAQPIELEVDERLSENNLIDFIAQLPVEDRDDWFRLWYQAVTRPQPNIFIGTDAVQAFSLWLLEKIQRQQNTPGQLHIDAFSHGPVMAAFVLRLEELMDQDIISSHNNTSERFEFDKLFTNADSQFMFLGSIWFFVHSANPDFVELMVRGRKIKVPIAIIEKLSKTLSAP